MMVPQWGQAAKQYALHPTMDPVKFNRSADTTPPPGRNPQIGRSPTSFAQRAIGRPSRITPLTFICRTAALSSLFRT